MHSEILLGSYGPADVTLAITIGVCAQFFSSKRYQDREASGFDVGSTSTSSTSGMGATAGRKINSALEATSNKTHIDNAACPVAPFSPDPLIEAAFLVIAGVFLLGLPPLGRETGIEPRTHPC